MKRKCMIWGLTLFFCCILSSCSPLSGTNSELETSQISSSYAESSTDHTHDSSAHSLNFATIEMDLSDAEEIYHLSTGKIYQYLGKWEDTRFFLLRMSESNKDSINEYYAIGMEKTAGFSQRYLLERAESDQRQHISCKLEWHF